MSSNVFPNLPDTRMMKMLHFRHRYQNHHQNMSSHCRVFPPPSFLASRPAS